MWKWVFTKVIKMREKVAVDLGQGDVEKPFIEHLEDLRNMIVRMAITLCIAVLITFIYAQELVGVVQKPLIFAGIVGDKIEMTGIKPTDYFMTAVNVSMTAGIIISFPILLYFLLQFILPGLRSNEKKMIFPSLAVGAGLFVIGILFSYFIVAPRALLFFYEYARDMQSTINPNPTHDYKWTLNIVEYVKFVSQFCLIFGACFELPVVVMALVKLDILNYKVMKGTRSWAIIIVFIVAAVITPTQDALTLGLLAVPMYMLYEICIWLAWWMDKKDRELHPEYYKGLDEDEKALEVEEDWDNDSYNPWSDKGNTDDDDDLKPKPKPVAPAPAPAATDLAPETEAEAATTPTPSPTELTPVVEKPVEPVEPTTPAVSEPKKAPESVEEPKEKTLEDYSREAEGFTGNPEDREKEKEKDKDKGPDSHESEKNTD